MNPRFLLDTHIVVRWLIQPGKLSREQTRVLRDAVRRHEPFAVSAITLLEIAVLFGEGTTQSGIALDKIFEELNSNPGFRILPFTVAIAAEFAALDPSLRDPSDRALVSTARVEKLKLVTSDQRIIELGLVPVEV